MTAFKDWTDRARAVPIESLLTLRGVKVRREGGELVGLCPRCGDQGHDYKNGPVNRFGLDIAEQKFNCRQCGLKGKGAIDFLMGVDGIDVTEARTRLAGDPPSNKDKGPQGQRQGQR